MVTDMAAVYRVHGDNLRIIPTKVLLLTDNITAAAIGLPTSHSSNFALVSVQPVISGAMLIHISLYYLTVSYVGLNCTIDF